MIKVGLTGSIGMGKSTVCDFFRKLGAKTWSADNAVHRLYEKNGAAIAPISKVFPSAISATGNIDRQILSQLIIKEPKLVEILEKIVHPLVKADREKFIQENTNEKYVILDIPLLFETNSQSQFDKIIVVDCDLETQKQRVMARKGMTKEKFEIIIANQMPNHLKTAKADIIIDTNRALSEIEGLVSQIHKQLLDL